jgi:hypothetical protein
MSTHSPVLLPPRRGALEMLGAALLGLAAACRDIRRISRTG